jgi:hypothetical protein
MIGVSAPATGLKIVMENVRLCLFTYVMGEEVNILNAENTD